MEYFTLWNVATSGVAIASAWAIHQFFKFVSWKSVMRKIPGPPPFFPIGNIHQMDPENSFDDYVKLSFVYGEMFVFWFFSRPIIVISDPALIREVIQNKDVWHRKFFFEVDDEVIGKVLFAIDGPSWKERRTRLNSSFRSQNVNSLFPTIRERAVKATSILIENSKKGKQTEIDNFMVGATMDIIFQFLVGKTFDIISGKKDFLKDYMNAVSIEVMLRNVGLKYLPIPSRIKFFTSSMKTHSFLKKVIRDRAKELQDEPTSVSDSILDMLLTHPSRLSDQEIADDLLGLMIAGHDTTSHTMAWAVYEVGRKKDVLAKLKEEVDAVIPGIPSVDNILSIDSLDQINKLTYLTAVIKETLRIWPPAGSSPLTATQDTTLAGHSLPKDTVVMCATYTIQRSPMHWKNPLTFNPDRFLETSSNYQLADAVSNFGEQSVKEQVYMPFLIGRHACIGQHLAMLELKVMLATLFKNLDITVHNEVKPLLGITLKPKEVLVSVKLRE